MKKRILKIIFMAMPWALIFGLFATIYLKAYFRSLREEGYVSAVSSIGEAALKNGEISIRLSNDRSVKLRVVKDEKPEPESQRNRK